jgi:hypothetical protein
MEAGKAAIPKIREVLEKSKKKKWWEKCLEYLAEGGDYV